MALYWIPFTAAVFLCGVSVTWAQGCTLDAADCSMEYTDRVSNFTIDQLQNKTLQCGVLSTYKSCLRAACGSWEAVPQQFTSIVQQTEQNLSCGSLEDDCASQQELFKCALRLQGIENDTDFFSDHTRVCNVMRQFRGCASEACGDWERVPKDVREGMDTVLTQYGVKCDWSSGAWRLGHVAAVLVLTVSVSLWMA